MKKTMFGLAAVTLAAALSGACATPAEPGTLVQPYRTMAQAEMEGAREHPESARHLERAYTNGKMAAQLILQEEDVDLVHPFVERARADAQLALEAARRENTEDALTEVEGALEVVDEAKEDDTHQVAGR